MKKSILLTVAFAMLASTGFAQDNAKTSKMSLEKKSITGVYKKDEIAAKPLRSVANGVYYTRETGTLFMGYDKEGAAYRGTFLMYPPFHEPVFYNQCSSKNVNWTINGNNRNNMMDAETGDFYYYELPKTCLDDTGLSSYYIPVISRGLNSFFICDTNKRDASANVDEEGNPNSNITCISQPDFDLSYTFSDFKTNTLYGGGSITAPTGDQGYIFGSGSITFSDGTTWKSIGVAQTLPAPVSPFTANEISFRAMSLTQPIAVGKSLTMQIRNVETLESGAKTFGDEIYETLVATYDDVSLAWTYSDGDNVYNICFHKKEVDEFGIESNVEFVLDKEFAILVIGFDEEGVDCGVMGLTMADEDETIIPEGIPLITNGSDLTSFGYQAPISVPVELWGYFDVIKVPTELYSYDNDENSPTYGEVKQTYSDCNVLRISPDGQQVNNDKWPEEFEQIVYFYASRDYEDEFGYANYEFDAPEWVSDITVIPFEDSDESGMYGLTVTCQPLPEGVTKRAGNLYILGSGVKSNAPIVLLQGDAEMADGIAAVTTENKTVSTKAYSLSGQEVHKNFKGVVISNGKKVIRK